MLNFDTSVKTRAEVWRSSDSQKFSRILFANFTERSQMYSCPSYRFQYDFIKYYRKGKQTM